MAHTRDELRALRLTARAAGEELVAAQEQASPGALRDATAPTPEMSRVLQEVVQLLQSKDGDPRANAINAAEILEHEGARYGGVTNVELHALAASCDERLGRDTDARGHLDVLSRGRAGTAVATVFERTTSARVALFFKRDDARMPTLQK